jgi:hypothetical protein
MVFILCQFTDDDRQGRLHRRTRRYGLPNDVTATAATSLLLPANHLFFSAI